MAFLNKKSAQSTPITPVNAETFVTWLSKQDKKTQSWAAASGYMAAKGSVLLVPDENGRVSRVVFGADKDDSLYTYAALPTQLPKNEAGYFIDKKMTPERAEKAALGWALGCYHYGTYKTGRKRGFSPLVLPDNTNRKRVEAMASALTLTRDLVNTPANDMGPAELAATAKKLAASHKATIKLIIGEDLLKQNYPSVYDVGKGSPRKPLLIDMRWGNAKNPMVTIVGKGVVFDTGGLDIKPSSAMLLMKKDMGGAAHALGLAEMIMSLNLPIRLRVLIPAVENATDGNSFRPGDVLKTRKGLTVEIGNTDAEGRLILADALTEACSEKPELIVDFATLTGAARVALGPDLPAMFCNDDKVAAALLESSHNVEDPMWRLPLWQPYLDMLNSKIADINNAGSGGFAGAITAALYLERFIEPGQPWVHIDTFAWNPGAKPGRPDGGEALGLRAVFDLLERKFTKKKAGKRK